MSSSNNRTGNSNDKNQNEENRILDPNSTTMKQGSSPSSSSSSLLTTPATSLSQKCKSSSPSTNTNSSNHSADSPNDQMLQEIQSSMAGMYGIDFPYISPNSPFTDDEDEGNHKGSPRQDADEKESNKGDKKNQDEEDDDHLLQLLNEIEQDPIDSTLASPDRRGIKPRPPYFSPPQFHPERFSPENQSLNPITEAENEISNTPPNSSQHHIGELNAPLQSSSVLKPPHSPAPSSSNLSAYFHDDLPPAFHRSDTATESPRNSPVSPPTITNISSSSTSQHSINFDPIPQLSSKDNDDTLNDATTAVNIVPITQPSIQISNPITSSSSNRSDIFQKSYSKSSTSSARSRLSARRKKAQSASSSSTSSKKSVTAPNHFEHFSSQSITYPGPTKNAETTVPTKEDSQQERKAVNDESEKETQSNKTASNNNAASTDLIVPFPSSDQSPANDNTNIGHIDQFDTLQNNTTTDSNEIDGSRDILLDYEEGIQQISQHPAVVVSNDDEDDEQHSRQYTMAKNVAQSIRLPKQEDGCPPSPSGSSRTPIASNVSSKNLNNNNNNSGEKRRESMLRIPYPTNYTSTKDVSSESTANSTFVPTSQQQDQQSLPWWLFPSVPTKQFSYRTKKRLKYAFIFGWILVLILITTAIILAVSISPSPSGPTADVSNQNTNPTSQPTFSPQTSPTTQPPTPPSSVTTPPTASPITPPITLLPTPPPQTLPPTKTPTPNPSRSPTASPTTKSPTPIPTAIPTVRNTSERENDILEKLFEISGRLTILDPTTPQNKAMEWIVNTDPVQTHPNDDQFIPRYSAATFYFATSSSSLWSNCGSDPSTSPCVNVVTSRIFDRPRSNNIPPSRFLSSSHVCHWFGITCNDEDQITVINIQDNGLKGTLPKEISLLQQLKTLILTKNQLQSTIPIEFTTMSTMENLILNRNELNGIIPSELGLLSNMFFLGLADNNFQGQIPPNIFVPTLKSLDLGANKLTGPIPSNIAQKSPELSQLDLSRNDFSGSLQGLRSLNKLRWVTLGNNRFTGSIPSDFFNENMIHLELQSNEMSGPLPFKK